MKKPEVTLPGRFVLASSEDTTSIKLLEDWSDVTGKPFKYVQISLEEYSAIWPGWGLEAGAMMAMWNELREKSWSGEDPIITKEELGLAGTKFATVKDTYATMDWNALL